MEARHIASHTGPQPIEASPMLAMTMPGRRLIRLKSAAPVAMSAEPPTMALLGMQPKAGKKACIEPPRPRLKPSLRAKISASVPKRMNASASSRAFPCGTCSAVRRVSPPRKPSRMAMSGASPSLREAERHLARISPWLRCEPKIWSSGSRLAHWPTAAASWPMERCAGPLWL